MRNNGCISVADVIDNIEGEIEYIMSGWSHMKSFGSKDDIECYILDSNSEYDLVASDAASYFAGLYGLI